MKFIMSYSWLPDAAKRAEGIARFQETGGLPPATVHLTGRWTHLDLGGGVAVLESNDQNAIAEFAMQWSDLMDISITPCLDDSELSVVLDNVGPTVGRR